MSEVEVLPGGAMQPIGFGRASMMSPSRVTKVGRRLARQEDCAMVQAYAMHLQHALALAEEQHEHIERLTEMEHRHIEFLQALRQLEVAGHVAETVVTSPVVGPAAMRLVDQYGAQLQAMTARPRR